MDNNIGVYYLARVIAAERTNTVRREPIILGRPGGLLRGVLSKVRSAWDGFDKGLLVPTPAFTYCTFNPSEC